MRQEELLSAIDAARGCLLVHGDSRLVLNDLPSGAVGCVVTSPPYYDLKDYGSENQIGYRQDIELAYYPDLKLIFSELLRVCSEGAACWVVLDMARVNRSVRSLPWAVADIAVSAGWSLQDLIVWDKGKSLPWTHTGRFRGVCEFILLLSKGALRCFDVDAVRDSENLSPYWQKYPERYNPIGAAPPDLWHFPIPVQGSWGSAEIRHSCPFPLELVNRMIQLTSRAGDLVLDPFAGSGSVLAMAAAAGRRAVGIELNSDYVSAFEVSGKGKLLEAGEKVARGKKDSTLEETIIRLRALKAPVALLKYLSRPDRYGVGLLANCKLVRVEFEPAAQGNSDLLGRVKMFLYFGGAILEGLKESAEGAITSEPLSKYRLDLSVCIESSPGQADLCGRDLWLYRNGRFYASGSLITCERALALIGQVRIREAFPPIIANVGVSV